MKRTEKVLKFGTLEESPFVLPDALSECDGIEGESNVPVLVIIVVGSGVEGAILVMISVGSALFCAIATGIATRAKTHALESDVDWNIAGRLDIDRVPRNECCRL